MVKEPRTKLKCARHVGEEKFREWLLAKDIRPASLEDMYGTQHDRPCYAHPRTGQPFVSMPNTEASRGKV